MLGFRKVRKYNSRNYDLGNTNDFEMFYHLIDVLNEFDFAIQNMNILYTADFGRANIHVETKERMLEIWLIKNQFVEA